MFMSTSLPIVEEGPRGCSERCVGCDHVLKVWPCIEGVLGVVMY